MTGAEQRRARLTSQRYSAVPCRPRTRVGDLDLEQGAGGQQAAVAQRHGGVARRDVVRHLGRQRLGLVKALVRQQLQSVALVGQQRRDLETRAERVLATHATKRAGRLPNKMRTHQAASWAPSRDSAMLHTRAGTQRNTPTRDFSINIARAAHLGVAEGIAGADAPLRDSGLGGVKAALGAQQYALHGCGTVT